MICDMEGKLHLMRRQIKYLLAINKTDINDKRSALHVLAVQYTACIAQSELCETHAVAAFFISLSLSSSKNLS